jgi:fatty-acyl-CoA synthase
MIEGMPVRSTSIWRDDARLHRNPAARRHSVNLEHTATGTYLDLVLNRLASRTDAEAFIAGDRRITRGEAYQIVLGLAQALGSRGAKKGDGIAVFAGNQPETVLVQLAIHFLGCRLILVPPKLVQRELASYLERADASFLVVDQNYSDHTSYIGSSINLKGILSLGPSKGRDLLREFAKSRVAQPHIGIRNDEIATLFYTGGTWGHPKIVTHGHVYYDSFILSGEIYEDSGPVLERSLICTAVTHGSGHFASFDALARGITAVLIGEFDAETALRQMKRLRITSVLVNPSMLYQLIDHPAWPEEGFPDLTRIHYTGGPTSPMKLSQAIARFGMIFHQIYGMTETGGITALEPSDHDPVRHETLRRCGKPTPGMEVRLYEEECVVTEPGIVGEVLVRGRKITTGYWSDPELTRSAFIDGWFRTGDIGFWDEQGYLCLVGRTSEVIITGPGSDNVYCRILDDLLLTIPGIRDVASVGVPAERYGEAAYVFVVAHPGGRPSTDAMRRLIMEELGPLYDPVGFSFVDELPLTSVGKIDKQALRLTHLRKTSGQSTASEHTASARD